ncbi:MAG: hypothetical protein KBC11_00995 [Candidatus Pacebacteria bacterium]|nr:hypothetical protein [Candidatus Paceibacterota bacterium]
MEAEKLANTSDEELLKFYKRGVELQGGKSPHDIDQLETEILRRMKKVTSYPKIEVGDEHDQFS